MDHTDWMRMTGSYMAGRGGYRPVNPKMLGRSASHTRSAKSSDHLARQMRRLTVQVARLASDVDNRLALKAPRRRVRTALQGQPSILEQSAPGAAGVAAQLRHGAIVQRFHRSF
jgi:hypothetical protein